MIGLRTCNWWLRTLTGALFGGASVWLALSLPRRRHARGDPK